MIPTPITISQTAMLGKKVKKIQAAMSPEEVAARKKFDDWSASRPRKQKNPG